MVGILVLIIGSLAGKIRFWNALEKGRKKERKTTEEGWLKKE